MPCSMLSMDLSAGSITRMDPPNKFAEKEEDEILHVKIVAIVLVVVEVPIIHQGTIYQDNVLHDLNAPP